MAVAGTPEEIARRVKAALGYKGIKLTKGGARQSVGGIGQSTVARIASTADSRTASETELQALAKATGVPVDFMLSGFASMETPLTDIEQRVLALEDALAGRLWNVEMVLARQIATDADLGEAARLLREHAQRLLGPPPPSSQADAGAG